METNNETQHEGRTADQQREALRRKAARKAVSLQAFINLYQSATNTPSLRRTVAEQMRARGGLRQVRRELAEAQRVAAGEPELLRVVVPYRVDVFLSGSGLWATDDPEEHGYGRAGEGLKAKMKAAPARKDNRVLVHLTRREAQVLADYTDVMVMGARDNIEPPQWAYGPNDALAEYNAGTALLRRLASLGIWPR